MSRYPEGTTDADIDALWDWSDEIPETVTCAWCDNPVPADSEGKFCSGSCEDADRADGDNFGRDA